MTLTPHPFLQLVINRAHGALKRLERIIWLEEDLTLSVEATDPITKPMSLEQAMQLPRLPFSAPEHWGKLYDFRWFRVVVPATDFGVQRYLHWEDESQACAWLEGIPYHGFDSQHRHCPIPAEGGEFWLESTCLSPFIAPFTRLSAKGTFCSGATLYTRNDAAWMAYQQLKVLYDLAMEERHDLLPEMGRSPKWFGYQPTLETVSPLYRRVLRQIDLCVTAYDMGGLESLNTSLAAAYTALRDDSQFKLRCTLIGHAHLDLVWLWPERIGEFKAQHTLASMNRLMEDYPEMRFLWTQPASYRAVAKRSPELLEAVRKRIKEGRWEATGAMEVESDTLIACGEALARGFVLGQEQFKELNGEASRVLWLPDVFGYAGCLPQLMRAFGVEYFFTTKLSWNALNRFPYSSFRWRGADGAEAVAHLTQDIGYNNTVGLDEIRLGERSHRQSDVHDEYLMPTGFGDGGGGPTPEMCERARSLAALAGSPKVSWDTATAFFDRLALIKEQLPVYEGELYFEYHRGTYTTHGAVKAAFRATERALQTVEAVQCALGAGPVSRVWWERLVFAQFHDYIPGSSVPPVYQEALVDLERVVSEAHASAISALEDSSGHSCLFNPLPLPLSVQLEECRLLIIPPLSGVSLNSAIRVSPVQASKTRLANEHVEASFSNAGLLTRLVIHGRTVALGAEGVGALWLYQDYPGLFESWDIDRQALDTGRQIDTTPEISSEVLPDGTAVLIVQRAVSKMSQVTLRYCLRPNRDVLEVEAVCDWHEPQALLKIEFPTGYLGQMARFGAPYGSVLRPQKPGDPRAEAMWEMPGSRYAIVLDDSSSEGLFLVTEAKYGFSCRDGCLSLSLIRSPMHTGLDGEAHDFMYPAALRTDSTTPLHTDQGRHCIRFALGHYTADQPRESQPAALADSLFTPAIAYTGLPCSTGLLGLEGDSSLVPSWAQPLGESCWILRCHEVLGRRGEVRLRLAPGWRATRASFEGKALDSSDEESGFAYQPYEIVSLLICRNPSS